MHFKKNHQDFTFGHKHLLLFLSLKAETIFKVRPLDDDPYVRVNKRQDITKNTYLVAKESPWRIIWQGPGIQAGKSKMAREKKSPNQRKRHVFVRQIRTLRSLGNAKSH